MNKCCICENCYFDIELYICDICHLEMLEKEAGLIDGN